jgi:hypothetical protein
VDFTGGLIAFFAVLLGAPALLAIAIVVGINRSWARRNRPEAVRLYTTVSTMAALGGATVAALGFYAVAVVSLDLLLTESGTPRPLSLVIMLSVAISAAWYSSRATISALDDRRQKDAGSA